MWLAKIGTVASSMSTMAYHSLVETLITRAGIDGYTIPSSTVLGYLSTLVQSLDDDGILADLDVMYVYATDADSAFARYNILDPTNNNCTLIGSPTFTSLEGFTGSSTAALNTNFIPSSDGVNFALSSACHGGYFRSIPTNSTVLAGSYDTSPSVNLTSLLMNRASGNNAISLNSNNGTGYWGIPDYANGMFLAERVSTLNSLYRNGSSVFSTTNGLATQLSDYAIYVLGRNDIGSLNLGSSAQVSMYWAGRNLGTTKNADFYTAVQAYMTNLGKQV